MGLTLDLGLNTFVLSFNFAVALVAGMLLGLAPALQGTRADVASTLKSESAGAGRPGKLTLRNGLVVAQVAASLVLLVGAGFLISALINRPISSPNSPLIIMVRWSERWRLSMPRSVVAQMPSSYRRTQQTQ